MAQNTVNDPSPAYEGMELDRKLARTLLYDGQRGIRAKGETYLPKYEGEDGSASDKTSEYGGRLSRSYLVNFYADTVQSFVGRVFQRPLVQSEDMPESIRLMWENIDNAGTHGDNFVQRCAIDSLGQGLSHILVDFQRPDGEFPTEEAERLAGVRPYWVNIRADKMIEAAAQTVNGRPYLQRARARLASTEIDGYDYSGVNQVKEFLMGAYTDEELFYAVWKLWQEDPETGEWYQVAGPYSMEPSRKATYEQRLLFIEPPIVAMYGGRREGFFRAKPLLQSQADLNLQHYQKKSDLDNIERIANVPVLVLEGGAGASDDMARMEVGAYRLVGTPEGQTLKYLEIQGAGITHAKDSLRHLEEHIRLVGKEPMVRKATGTELATTRLLDEASTLTQAQAVAMSWVGSVNRCLDLTAAWMGIPTAGSVSISEDVMEALSRPEGFEDVLRLLELGAIAPESAQEEARRYGVLDRDFDIEQDAERRQAAPPLI